MEGFINRFRLDGKNALVIGGNGGLGKFIVRAFMECGAAVAVGARHPEKTAAELEQAARDWHTAYLDAPVDITDEKSVVEMAAALARKMGHIDILVNAAGINILKKAEDYDAASFDRVMDINLRGTHLVSREIGRQMIARRFGRIINISSVKGVIGTGQDYAAYCASKGAVNMYTRQLACEWGKYGITCNAIAPTFVRTPINSFQLDDEAFYHKLTARIPLGRIGKGEDIAGAAVYLASEAAGFVSGQILAVDGGLTAMQ